MHGLKQQSSISQFPLLGNSATSWLGSLVQGLLQDCNQGNGQERDLNWKLNRLDGLEAGKDLLPSSVINIHRIHFLRGSWSEGLSFSLAVGQRPCSVTCHGSLSIGQFTIWKLTYIKASERAREGAQERSQGLLVA